MDRTVPKLSLFPLAQSGPDSSRVQLPMRSSAKCLDLGSSRDENHDFSKTLSAFQDICSLRLRKENFLSPSLQGSLLPRHTSQF